jgi:hypothetical protein
MTNLGPKIGAEQLHQAKSHEQIRSNLKKCRHVHGTVSLLALRNRGAATRLDPQYRGQPRWPGGSEDPVFIGRATGIAQVEIVCEMVVRANE